MASIDRTGRSWTTDTVFSSKHKFLPIGFGDVPHRISSETFVQHCCRKSKIDGGVFSFSSLPRRSNPPLDGHNIM